jgi:pimeloyl-ACP methyl ester carboxylesterase
MRARTMATAVAAGIALTVGAMTVPQVSASEHHRTTGSDTTGGLARFYDQQIGWHGCQTGPDDEIGKQLDAAGAQCGQVSVPLDYRRPYGRTITVAMSRMKASDPVHRRGVLLLNAGGPGVPGLPQVLINQLVPDVAARYDLIGMDPRFVGRSTPLDCHWPTNDFFRSAGPTRQTFDETVALEETLAAGCAAGNQDLLPYASTRDTARDMDVVRAALGEKRISYVGSSYGTYLGAVYLQMFGPRADRIVLDGPVDPKVFGPGVLSRNDPAATAALRHWAAFAADHNSQYGLGATTSGVLATVDQIDQAATRSPLRIGRFQVDTHLFPYFVFLSLYNDDTQAYSQLAADVQVLNEAAHGAAPDPTPMLEQFLTGITTGSGGDATARSGLPVLCADRAVSHDPDTYFQDIETHRSDEPLFGPLFRDITPCAFWPTSPVEPPTTISNDVPALMVASAGDPVSPYAGSQTMHRALRGSRLVTLRGSFHHTAYLDGDPCIDTAVNHYLTTGVLPATDTTCTTAGTARSH